jgi:ABC-2 type transport system ATP-binding protein
VAEAPAAVAIEAAGLAHRYGRNVGLAATDFTLAAPAVVAVTGPNGAGKSTLLRALAGLLAPTGGTLRVTRAGAAWPAAERRLAAGFASPDVLLYEEMSAQENLRFAARGRGLADPERAVDAALERVGLTARAGERIGALSSGWRQRARLAFAVLGDPVLLLLDEPGSHLDEAGRQVVESLTRERRAGRLLLIATNDEREWKLGEQRIDLAGGLGRPS